MDKAWRTPGMFVWRTFINKAWRTPGMFVWRTFINVAHRSDALAGWTAVLQSPFHLRPLQASRGVIMMPECHSC